MLTKIFFRKRTNTFLLLALLLSFSVLTIHLFAQDGGDGTNEKKDQAPSGKIYNDGKTVYATSAAKFRIDISDNLSQPDYVEYKVDSGDFQRYAEPFAIEKDGKHVITYRGVDKAGNVEKDRSFEIIIDNTAPNIFIPNSVSFVTKGEQKFLSSRAKISFIARDELSGVKSIEYNIDNEGYKVYTGPFLPGKQGKLQIKYKATDNLGNVSEEKVLDVNVDGQAPTVKINPEKKILDADGKKYSPKDNNYTVVATDDNSGVVRILIKATGDNDFREYTGPISFTTAGEKTIEAKALDRVGNESDSVRLSFTIDDTPPETKLIPVIGQ